MTQVLLLGNPNCGKTTLFNALTGQQQNVGNWSGVTVEKKTAAIVNQNHSFMLTDLPGVYSLTAAQEGHSLDENITVRAIIDEPCDLIINVIDACHLERHLYLTSQLLERKIPLIVVLNMTDLATKQGIDINVSLLSKRLGCAVVALAADKNVGLDVLKKTLDVMQPPCVPLPFTLTADMQTALQDLESLYVEQAHSPSVAFFKARRVMDGDLSLLPSCSDYHDPGDWDLCLADARYQAIHTICLQAQIKRSDRQERRTAKIDCVVLHRWFGIPVFLTLMYLMFVFAMNIGGVFQVFFDEATHLIFVQGAAWALDAIHAPTWLTVLCAQGVGVGLNTTLTFIPVIALMFLFLSFLEASGYMARAAFVMDKVMRMLGLPGRAFVPLIIGFGCNVPAIMATRTLDNQRDRWLTMLMTPFMSCSARLAIYAVFVSAFFPNNGQNVVFSLYLLGIGMAIVTGLVLKKTFFQGAVSPLIIELPTYQRPRMRALLAETSRRLRAFLVRAGRLIIPVCVVLSVLNFWTVPTSHHQSISLVEMLGQWLTPIFAPMGLQPDNWPACVSLVTGMLAKEVVIGTLNNLYAHMGPMVVSSASDFHFWSQMSAAWMTIPTQLSQLSHAMCHPFMASMVQDETTLSATNGIVQHFAGKASAYAYLVFVLLYIPCVSTMAVMRQEANHWLMWGSMLWSLLIAYVMAVLCYQLATYIVHPQQTLLWCLGVMLGIAAMYFTPRLKSRRYQGAHLHVTLDS